MLKLIPQEQPEGIKRTKRSKKGNHAMPTNFPKMDDSILEITGKKLLVYYMKPQDHTDEEIKQLIHSCHRSILCMQRKRQQKGKKKKK